ncbi:MAG: site-specific tyrosine recombinase XerD [Chitinophagales bacterium]
MMNWNAYKNGFKAFLLLERKLSKKSVEAYLSDLRKFHKFVATTETKSIKEITTKNCQAFLQELGELGIAQSSQARVLSSLKSFFKYLSFEKIIVENPAELLEAPRQSRKIPAILSLEEINLMLKTIDQSTPEGVRNKAIIETLYACGLRVSELVNLQISDLYLEIKYIKVIGKGDKDRLVPINSAATKQIKIYQTEIRKKMKIAAGHEDILFLNRRGKQLTRVMIFLIVKKAAKAAGLVKNVSPHTFRHSFATHLYENGADLRMTQDMLGHESITTTEIYSHISTQHLRDALMQFHPRF